MPRVGIVGAAGRYGRWVETFLRAHGLAEDIAGHDPASPTSWSIEALVEWSEVLVFCAPLTHTLAAIEAFAALAGDRAKTQLWIDLTSVKVGPVTAMQASGAEVLGLHPLCAPPSTPDLIGQRMVVCEARLESWRPWAEAFLAATGADCIALTAEEHDRRAALVQALGHAAHLSQLMALAKAAPHASLQALASCATPTFQLDLAMGMRLLSGDPGLYAGLLSLTPESRAAIADLAAACQQLLALSHSADPAKEMTSLVESLREWAGTDARVRGEQAYVRAIAAVNTDTH